MIYSVRRQDEDAGIQGKAGPIHVLTPSRVSQAEFR